MIDECANHQTPNTKLQRSSKLQIPNGAAMPLYWALEFGASLGFGVWCLELSSIPLDNDEIRMTKSERSPKPEIRTKRLSPVAFDIRISDLIGHSPFDIRHS
jgi:hypothetical protein